jgi:iron complex transport system ATP-binding protein
MAMTLRVENLEVKFERFRLEVPRLEFPPSSLTAVVGPNAAGKSTLLRSLALVLEPGSKSVFFDGRDAAGLDRRERARLIAYVPQELSLSFNYSVLDFLLTGRAAYIPVFSSPGRADLAAGRSALAYLGLGQYESAGMMELSSGIRRLVMIARALVQEAAVLVLDEPTTFLDPKHELETLALLRRLVDEKGKTVITALHSLEAAAAYTDRVVVVKDGRLVAAGPPGEVLVEPVLERTYEMGFTVVDVDGRTLFVKKDLGR